jgi:hypothetical protein
MTRLPESTRRRALILLASCPAGCTEAVMQVHGFTVEQIAELVRTGLATKTAERMLAEAQAIEVAWVRITAEGQRAFADRD